MPSRQVGVVHGGGLVQAVALVAFPASSAILTSPQYDDLSSSAYGALFLGLGTALAPVLVAVFVGIGFWWGLPLVTAIAIAGLIALSLPLPLAVATSPALSFVVVRESSRATA